MLPIILKTLAPILIQATIDRLARPGEPAPKVDKQTVKEIVRDVTQAPEVQEVAAAAKPWWMSKTVWSSAGVVVVSLGSVVGLSVTTGDVEEAYTAVSSIVTAVLALVAIYGRLTAKKNLR